MRRRETENAHCAQPAEQCGTLKAGACLDRPGYVRRSAAQHDGNLVFDVDALEIVMALARQMQPIADEDQGCIDLRRPSRAARGNQCVLANAQRRCAAIRRHQFSGRGGLIDDLLLEGDRLQVALDPRGLQTFGLESGHHVISRAQITPRSRQPTFGAVISNRCDVGPPLAGFA